MHDDSEAAGLITPQAVWQSMADVYERELDARFAPVVREVIACADLRPGNRVLDLGSGTGSVAIRAAPLVAPGGTVVGVDISEAMLARARQRMSTLGLTNVRFIWGQSESIPADDAVFDVVIASLSLMFVPDRAAAAREIARVLRPGGRFVASAWAGPECCAIVRFQQTAGSFASAPLASGVGPGALADPAPLIGQLSAASIVTRVESVVASFEFGTFSAAWDALAGVTAASLAPGWRAEAQAATQAAMGWDDPAVPHRFDNLIHLLVGTRQS